MLETLLSNVSPYMLQGLAWAKMVAPVFVLLAIIYGIITSFYANKQEGFNANRYLITPLLYCGCLWFYPDIVKTFEGFVSITLGYLVAPEITFSELIEAYKTNVADNFTWWNPITWLDTISGALSMLACYIALKLASFIALLVSACQFFFKTAVYLAGPFAILIAILPPYQKVVNSWFNYLMYFTLWSVSVWIVSVLVGGMFLSMIGGDSQATGSTVVGASATAGVAKAAGLKNTVAAIKALKTAKAGTAVATGGASLAITFAGSFIYPFLCLFLYCLVPKITSFFFKSTGMENILSAGMAFMTSQVKGIYRNSQKVYQKGSQAKQVISEARRRLNDKHEST